MREQKKTKAKLEPRLNRIPITIRLSPGLVEAAKNFAKSKGVTMTRVIEKLLEDCLSTG